MVTSAPVTYPFVWIFGISTVIVLLIVVFICIRRKKKKYKFLGSMDIATVFGQITAEDNAEMRANEPDPLLCPSGASGNAAQHANKREPTASGSSKRTESKSCFANQQPAVNMGGCRQKSKSTFHATLRDFNVETSPENGTAKNSKPNRGPRSDYEGIYLKHPNRNPYKSRPLPQIQPSQLILTEEERASLPENALRRLQSQSLKHNLVSNFHADPANRPQSVSTEHVPKNLSKQTYKSRKGNQKNTLPMANSSNMARRPLPPIQMDGNKPLLQSDKNMKKQETPGEKRIMCVKPLRPEQFAVSTDSVGNPAGLKGSPSAKKKTKNKKPKDISFEFPKKPKSYGNTKGDNINKPQVKEDSTKTLKLDRDRSNRALESPQQVYALKYIPDNYSDAPKNQQVDYQRRNILSGTSEDGQNEQRTTQLTPSGSSKSSPSHFTVEGKSNTTANLFKYFSEDITLPSNELEADPSRSVQTEGQSETHNLMKPNGKTEEDATVQLLTNGLPNTGPSVAKISSIEQSTVDNTEHVLSAHNSNGKMSKNKDMSQAISSDPHNLGVPKNDQPKDALSAEVENEPELQLTPKDVLETKTPELQVLKSAPEDPVSLKSPDTKAPLATEDVYESGNVKAEMQPSLRPANKEGKLDKPKDAKPKAKVFSIPRGGSGMLGDLCQL
ncbi:uncharacterized protein LOC124255097 [Haliotis rubra]|uniref:uncharacterized protein LOC124255097 n=1 Tax=Haliotis rubra TaxID=36100 RepID=UPI001EE52A00|nr:uncharacterized protein LOC124255097 [Haliotis rubra]